jgi:nicotinamidase-related amidase
MMKEVEMIASPLSPDTAVFLLVDHQTGVFERVVKVPPREQVEHNVLRLARAAAILEIPVILTTSEEDGENGPLLPALEEILPDAYASRIDRHGIIDSLAAQDIYGFKVRRYVSVPDLDFKRIKAEIRQLPDFLYHALRAHAPEAGVGWHSFPPAAE